MKLRVLALGFVICLAAVGVTPPHSLAPAAAQTIPTGIIYFPHVAGELCGPFLDPFDGPSTAWFTGQSAGLRAELVGGEYRLLIDGPGTVGFIDAPTCKRVSYRAAVDVRWAGPTGNFYGLVFDINDALGRSYLFAANTDARVWLVFEVRDDSLDTVIAPTAHDAIRPGGEVNRLAAERAGGAIILSINGTPVGELPDGLSAVPVLAGIAAASYTTQSTADARFDNFLYEN